MSGRIDAYRLTDRMMMLSERAGVAAGRLAAVPSERLAAAEPDAARRHARLSARLDGSPLEHATADEVDRRRAAAPTGPGPSAAPSDAAANDAAAPTTTAPGAAERGAEATPRATDGWSAALRIDRLPTQDAAAREYANVLDATALEAEVAASFFDHPLHVMSRLHEALCAGLVADDVVARLRRTQRAIHDGAQGRMLWSAPAPDRLPALMDSLLEWLGDRSVGVPTLVVAAIVHERLLEWQPFEAANGRLARSVSRIVRRARGLDPHGLAVPEVHWAATTLAYHREVAATIRRRGNLSRWIERTLHAEAIALEEAADLLLPTPAGAAPARVVDLLGEVGPGGTVTDKDAAARMGVSRERAAADLEGARQAGLVTDDLTVPVRRYRVIIGT